jgi:KaiC/GvpD/RAD55 family RecA-like ATPase
MSADDRSLATGIDVLDRKLGGGVPMGGVVTLSASSRSQSELFLYEFAARRRTVYASTLRTAEAIREAITAKELDTDGVEIERLDPEAPLKAGRELLADVPPRSNIIIDPVGPLEEQDPERYRQFLAELEAAATAEDHVVFLHCLREPEPPTQRRDTLHLADLVFHLTTEREGQSVVNRLTVPKFRGGQSVDDVIKLDLTAEVEVDVSRNIV